MQAELIERVNDALAHVRLTEGTDAELSTRAVLFDAQRHGLNETVSKAIITQILEHGGDKYEGQPRFKLMVSASSVSLFAEIIVEADNEDAARDLIENDDERARDLLAGATWQLEDDTDGRFGTARPSFAFFAERHTIDVDDTEEVDSDVALTAPASQAVITNLVVTGSVTATDLSLDGAAPIDATVATPAPVIKSWDVTFKYGEPVRYHEVTGIRAATADEAHTQARGRVAKHIGEGAWRAIPEDAGTAPIGFSDGTF